MDAKDDVWWCKERTCANLTGIRIVISEFFFFECKEHVDVPNLFGSMSYPFFFLSTRFSASLGRSFGSVLYYLPLYNYELIKVFLAYSVVQLCSFM